MPSTSTSTPTPTSTTTTTANNKNKIPLSDLSKGEYELWKDAQLIGHFESWKRERRENKSRIERLEAEVEELRRAVVGLFFPYLSVPQEREITLMRMVRSFVRRC